MQGISAGQETTSTSTLNANKAGAIFTFLGASAAGVWLPFFIPVNPEILKFGVLFSAGLFISMALLELSREAYEEMEQATGSSTFVVLDIYERIRPKLVVAKLLKSIPCRLPIRFPGRHLWDLLDMVVRYCCEDRMVKTQTRFRRRS